jgi:uncharacterized protein YuzE
VKVEYDQQADALYIALTEDAEVVRTVEIDPGTLVDVGSGGRLLGVEIIRPARPWPVDEILRQFHADPAAARLLRLLEPSAAGPARTFAYADPVQFVAIGA